MSKLSKTPKGSVKDEEMLKNQSVLQYGLYTHSPSKADFHGVDG